QVSVLRLRLFAAVCALDVAARWRIRRADDFPLPGLIGESVADSELHWQDPKRSKLRRFWFLLGLRPRHRGSGPFRRSCYGPPIQPAYPAKTAPAAMKTRAVGRDRLCNH